MKDSPTDAMTATRARAVASRRRAVERAFRRGERGAGPRDHEGRSYAGLLRHLTPAPTAAGFVATHAERLRGGTAPVTAGPACRALNQRCAVALRRRRGAPGARHAADVIRYHRGRNAPAAKSHKKQRRNCVI